MITVEQVRSTLIRWILIIQVWWTTRNSSIFDSSRQRYTFYAPSGVEFDDKAIGYLKEMQLQHWFPGELDFSRDVNDFVHLPKPMRELIIKLLAFFSFGDGVVDEVIDSVKEKIKIPEVRAFYPAQEENEIVHGQTYGDMLEAFVPVQTERDYLLKNIGKIAKLDKKLAWVERWTNPKLPLPILVGAMVLIEQVWFSTAFNIINWLRVINTMPEMVKANEFIIRNENLHGDYAAYLLTKYFNYKENKALQSILEIMIKEAKEAEVAFIDEISKPLVTLEEDIYSGVQFNVLYKHLGCTIAALRLQLEGVKKEERGVVDLSKDKENIHLTLLTGFGVGQDNFFEYRAPSYQNSMVGTDTVDKVVDAAFNDE